MTASAEGDARDRRAIALWLFGCCALLLLLIAIGGATRLTRSGLSIPNWRPVTGVLPPLHAEAWERAFAEYRETPEFRLVNPFMTLAEYRRIYAWEYVHRLVARLLGVAFAVPLAVLAWRCRLPPGFGLSLAAILALGVAQGAMGWLMVHSGLVDEPRVSHLRLAVHFGLALSIFGAMLWAAVALSGSRPVEAVTRRDAATRLTASLVVAVFVQALGGALMAGTRAGYLFPTFPKMAGELVPGGLFALSPWPRSLLDDPVTIHFVHRWMGVLVVVLALAPLAATWIGPANRAARRRATGVVVVAVVTAGLGITTVLTRVAIVPAVVHQLCAVLLFGSALVALRASCAAGPEGER